MKYGIILERYIGNNFRNLKKKEVILFGEIRGSFIEEVEYVRFYGVDRI